MKSVRQIILAGLLVGIGMVISMVFWFQEIKYIKPTPQPENYREVPLGTQISIGNFFEDNHPKLLHFYNPTCPCSKFNTAHIKELEAKYGNEVKIYIVTEKDRSKVYNEFELPVIEDVYGILADSCGVYSTPQAVVLDRENKIYYRGNYNKERYCTVKNSNFAEIAINNLLAGDQKTEFSELATRSYGCQLLSDVKTGYGYER